MRAESFKTLILWEITDVAGEWTSVPSSCVCVCHCFSSASTAGGKYLGLVFFAGFGEYSCLWEDRL